MKQLKKLYNRIPDTMFGEKADRLTAIATKAIAAWAVIILIVVIIANI